jgi:hypothetical protein
MCVRETERERERERERVEGGMEARRKVDSHRPPELDTLLFIFFQWL